MDADGAEFGEECSELEEAMTPDKPAAGKAGIARLLASEYGCPGLPEPGR